MIIDLAVYEKEPDAVKATQEMMRENVFQRGYAGVFVVRAKGGEEDGKAVGFALVCLISSSLSLNEHSPENQADISVLLYLLYMVRRSGYIRESPPIT